MQVVTVWYIVLKLTEAQFQKQIVELAQYYRWLVAHFRPAWNKKGDKCRTPVQADGAGYPDLCMVKEGRIIFAEVKSEGGVVSSDQWKWLTVLESSQKCEVYIWYPRDWESIKNILTR